ncbi:hypothetical protein [Faecalibacter macacae]|uniref:Lipoprotein n=1 Tax=Faecalibacter macacae TaxID=1859289 RepID=A0A3L9MH64_9FLAO|nr:hypothetical protein [Faecalibacter macacae]RLZ12198.1 hypothetical protein EAH69_01345 [Faecalibacter macacae]
MKKISILYFTILILVSCQSRQNMFGKNKMNSLIDTFIELGESEKKINPDEYYLHLILATLTEEQKKAFNADFGVGLEFIRYTSSCHANEKSPQYLYKGYTINVIDSVKMDFNKYSFLQKVDQKKLNISIFPCEHLIYDPLFYGVYFNEKGIIQTIEPWAKKRKLRNLLLKNNFKINLDSEYVYSNDSIGKEIIYE